MTINNLTGYDRASMNSRIVDAVGDNSTEFSDRVNNDFDLLQWKFYNLHDWKFKHKNGVEDGVKFTLGTSDTHYVLNVATITVTMRNKDIEAIYSQSATYGRKLEKVDLRQIRIWDPNQQNTGFPTHWAPVGRQGIVVYPKPTSDINTEVLYIDGASVPNPLDAAADFTDIPYDYQLTFMQGCLANALWRNRDPRWKEEWAMFERMVAQDIADDMREFESNARFKWAEEEVIQPQVVTLNQHLWFVE